MFLENILHHFTGKISDLETKNKDNEIRNPQNVLVVKNTNKNGFLETTVDKEESDNKRKASETEPILVSEEKVSKFTKSDSEDVKV